MNQAFKKTAAFLLSAVMTLSYAPASYAETNVDSGETTQYSVKQGNTSDTKGSNEVGGTYAAVLRGDKTANAAQTETVAGYNQQVETQLTEAKSEDITESYFEQDKYLSDPTGTKNGQNTYNVTLENAYVGPQIENVAPDGQDIIIIEDTSASMNSRVKYENEGVQAFLQKVYKINQKRIENAANGVYADYDPTGKTTADAAEWLKTNNKLLHIVGVESFNYTTYTKWKDNGGSYVLSLTEAANIAKASTIKDGYPNGEELRDLTATDKALQDVRSWITDAENTSIVLLTDGEPYGAYSNDDLSNGNTELLMFNSTTANNAIRIAKEIKAAGTDIYASFMFYESGWDNDYLHLAMKNEDISDLKMPPYCNISAVTLSLISSDYPNGGSIGTVSGGTGLDWTFSVDKTNANGFGTYMTLMQNEEKIASSIASIADQVDIRSIASALKESGYASVTSSIIDDISYPFTLDGDVDDIKVYQVPRVPTDLDSTGYPTDASNVTSFTWGEKEDITDQVTVTYENNRIVVTGYNYEDHALTTYDHDLYKENQGSNPDKYNTGDYGYKLVVEFPIKAKPSFGGNDIETNDSTTSGFYPSKPGEESGLSEWTKNGKLNPDSNDYVALYPVPVVDLKVNYKIIGQDINIYAPQKAKVVNLVTGDADSPDALSIFYIGETKEEVKEYYDTKTKRDNAKSLASETQAAYNDAYTEFAKNPTDSTLEAKVADAKTAWDEAKAAYKSAEEEFNTMMAYIPDGDNNAFVDITYTLTSPSGEVIGTMRIPHGTALTGDADNTGNLKWTFTGGDDMEITEDGEYKISATVTPVYTTRAESHTGSSNADDTCKAETFDRTQTAHIFQLKITMQDTSKKPGQTLDFTNDANEDVFDAADSSEWNEEHWVKAEWVCVDGATKSDPENEPGTASKRVGAKPTGLVTLGSEGNVEETSGTLHVATNAEDGAVIPARISVSRYVGDINKNASVTKQFEQTLTDMSDDDHRYGDYSSIVWEHECSVVTGCDENEFTQARENIDSGAVTGQNITRFLVHVVNTTLPDVTKTTTTPTIHVGETIKWTASAHNDNASDNPDKKASKGQLLDILPYQDDGRIRPSDNTDTGSSFGGSLYIEKLILDCTNSVTTLEAIQSGEAKLYYTTDTAVRTATREQWYGDAITWEEAEKAAGETGENGTIEYSIPKDAAAVKVDFNLKWNESIDLNIDANVESDGRSLQEQGDYYLNQAIVANSDSSATSDPVETIVTAISISGTVWYDHNYNGQLDGNEDRTSGVTVTLYQEDQNPGIGPDDNKLTLDGTVLSRAFNASDAIVSKVYTADDGTYVFDDLKPGTYYVVATELPDDCDITTKEAEGAVAELNSKAEETKPAENTAWIKKIVVGNENIAGLNIGLVSPLGSVTIRKTITGGALVYPSSLTEKEKESYSKAFLFVLTNKETKEEYTATVVVNANNLDDAQTSIKNIPLGTYTLREMNELDYTVENISATKGKVLYNVDDGSADVILSEEEQDVYLTVENRPVETKPGVKPGESVVNHAGTGIPIKLQVEYTKGDINDTSAITYRFGESDFANMTVWYDDGRYRDFTGEYKQDSDGNVTKLSDYRLKFEEVTLYPVRVSNTEINGSSERVKVIASYTEGTANGKKTLTDKFYVKMSLMPVHKFEINFHANGGTFDSIRDINTVKFGYEDAVSSNYIISGVYMVPDTRSGFTFAGWNTASDASGTNYSGVAALNVLGQAKVATQYDLYARWKTNIIFSANGGTLTGGTSDAETALNGMASGSIEWYQGQKIVTNLSATKANEQFVEWNTKADGTGTKLKDYGACTGSVTFYAIYVQKYWSYEYTGDVQTFTAPVTGIYRLQVVGASGGVAGPNTGQHSTGATVEANITLKKGESLYTYVGGQGGSYGGTGGWNGGGNATGGGGAGGGATDFRTVNSGSSWNDSNGLWSRVIVAAGAGGGGQHGIGGVGGDTTGDPGRGDYIGSSGGLGGSQTSGGNYGGSFGQGGSGTNSGASNGGGGGGWYGGGASNQGSAGSGGGGGSSYIASSLSDGSMSKGKNLVSNGSNGFSSVTLLAITE